MLIRYHLIYYALGILLVTLGRMIHPLFYLVMIFYLVWLLKRTSYKHMLLMLFLALLVFIPVNNDINIASVVSGRVVKVSEHYCLLKCKEGIIQLYHNNDILYHDDLRVKIELLEMHHHSNDNAFDEYNYLKSLGVVKKAKLVSLLEQRHHKGLYHWILEHLSKQQDVNDYQRLLLLGEKTESIKDDYQLLSHMSLVHLFALSGMHIHLLVGLLCFMFGLFLNQRVSRYIAIICVGLYVLSIPMSLSLYRAFFVLLLYELLKKWFNQMDVLCLLVIFYLFYNPYIIYNPSFVFSYFVYFIVLLTKHCKRQYLYIYISTIPLICYMNMELSLLSFILGWMMVPMIECLYLFIVGSVFFPFLSYVIQIFIFILQKCLVFLDAIDSYLIIGYPTFMFVGLFYILFFMMLYKDLRREGIRVCLIGICCLLVVFRIYNEYRIYGDICMIDVGQGDCTLIRLPMNQGSILIDTGGHHSYDIATNTIIPYLKSVGIHHLDYVYISHDDFDHCGALDSLVKHFEVRHVIREFEKERVIGNCFITMLEYEKGIDSNDQSLVMKVDIGDLSLLFLGDCSKDIEQQLYDRYNYLDIDILKVSHHGSHSATSPVLFKMIQPSIAMIGVKKDNMYHHPHNEVINRLKRQGVIILRTDIHGMFHIRLYDDRYYIFE